jgi:hypothetical protein
MEDEEGEENEDGKGSRVRGGWEGNVEWKGTRKEEEGAGIVKDRERAGKVGMGKGG